MSATIDQGGCVDDEIMSPAGLAEYLHVPLNTVYAWRARGDGPRGARVGKHVRYRKCDVDAWLASRADEPRGAA